jgi:hypothetical protein
MSKMETFNSEAIDKTREVLGRLSKEDLQFIMNLLEVGNEELIYEQGARLLTSYGDTEYSNTDS